MAKLNRTPALNIAKHSYKDYLFDMELHIDDDPEGIKRDLETRVPGPQN